MHHDDGVPWFDNGAMPGSHRGKLKADAETEAVVVRAIEVGDRSSGFDVTFEPRCDHILHAAVESKERPAVGTNGRLRERFAVELRPFADLIR